MASLDAIVRLRDALVSAGGSAGAPIDGAVVGVPGVVDATTGRVSLATSVPGLEGDAFGPALRRRLEVPVSLENDVDLAAVGELWRGVARGMDDFAFLSVGTGIGAGLVLRGELHRGHHGAAGELDFALVGLGQDVDPCAGAISAFAARLAEERGFDTELGPPFDARAIFSAARANDPLGRAVVDETARRIALHLVPDRVGGGRVARRSWWLAWARTATCSSRPCAATSRAGFRFRHASRSRASARRRCSPERWQWDCAPRSTTSSASGE